MQTIGYAGSARIAGQAGIRKAIICVAAVLVCWALQAVEFQVKNVEARQRFPWNGKVDIDFQIECDESSRDFVVNVQCFDNIGKTNLTVNTLKYHDTGIGVNEFTLRAGRHRITWDADADAPGQEFGNVSVAVLAKATNALDSDGYLIIDVSGGPSADSYPVTTCTGIPNGGWSDEYKTRKIALRRCPKGKSATGDYRLTQDFYAGVFEITQRQWELVMGTLPYVNSYEGNGDDYPVRGVSYEMIRGAGSGVQWPANSSVDSTSFIGKLRAKTGLNTLDLPTSAQWEHACRAGRTTKYNVGDDDNALAVAGWYSGNNNPNGAKRVGQKVANAWGIYDMHGNVWEWCLDWGYGNLSGTDPTGPETGWGRCTRGGCFYSDPSACESRRSGVQSPGDISSWGGFRLFRTIP